MNAYVNGRNREGFMVRISALGSAVQKKNTHRIVSCDNCHNHAEEEYILMLE